MVNNIIKFVEELSENSLIELESENLEFVKFKLKRDSYLEFSEDIKENLDIDLSKDELEIDGFQVKWHKPYFKDSLGHIYGGFSFNVDGGLFGDQDERIKENPLNHPQELVDNLYSFNDSEIVRHMSQNGRGCFYREKGKWPLDIYFFDKGVRIKMDMSLEEYVQALIDSCAIAYWQYFYVDMDELVKQNKQMLLRYGGFNSSPSNDEDLDSPRLKYLIDELEIFVANLPISFPEKDFSYHKNRLAQIKEKAEPYL